MNRSDIALRTRTLPLLAATAATGLALAGCGGTSGSGSSIAGSTAPASQPTASTGSSAGTGSAASSGTVTAPAIFPVAVGDTWVYQDKVTAMQGTVTNQVAAITPNAGGGERVTMKSHDDLAGVPHAVTTSTFIIHPDGSISVPLTQVGTAQVTVKSGSIIWPSAAQLASGQPHTDTLLVAVTVGGHAMTVKAHIVVRGAGTQTVHVPAGTYQATVINETMTEKVMGFSIALDVRTWLAAGVGPVKSEVSTREGSLGGGIASEQVLKSFTKG
jgi:hypothetical protein